MMKFTVFEYLFQQIVYRIGSFLRHWYINGFLNFWNRTRRILNAFDRHLAIKITIRHWSEPLYQDKTVVGYILGFVFRTSRILIGSVIYLVIFLVFTGLFLIWAAIPPFLVIKSLS